jgi:hypothetical protein
MHLLVEEGVMETPRIVSFIYTLGVEVDLSGVAY